MISLFVAVVLCWTFIVFLISPFYKKTKEQGFIEVLGFDSLIEEQPTKLNFQFINKDAYLKNNEIQQIWVIKHSSKKATVFSPICPHLGCRYNWNSNIKKFVCPCHVSIFTRTGEVVSGPAPRPLDTLPSKIENGTLYVKWEEFKPGLSKKIEIYAF